MCSVAARYAPGGKGQPADRAAGSLQIAGRHYSADYTPNTGVVLRLTARYRKGEDSLLTSLSTCLSLPWSALA
ncbi:hypothetical protein LSAT2_004035 [Lamellibrachia satsuma]|nr:hypothetical protein LSAT2_004035 [Lamellibrachia satsuma]